MTRHDNRQDDSLRAISFERGFTRYAGGSVLATAGHTRILCTAYIEDQVPNWREGKQLGWATAEYSMLPSSTAQRRRRTDAKSDGRAREIQRLIGRSLRAVVDMAALGERTILVDCDVLQADGGTRTLSISGAYVAMVDAVNAAMASGLLERNPLTEPVAAVSVGVVNGNVLLDLDYSEDVRAEVDFNVVMTAAGNFIEMQGTAEHGTFDRQQLDGMLAVADKGIREIIEQQQVALGT